MSNLLTDRRAIRTKKMIRNALSELIEEKGFNSISVKDLTTRADINRGTFYLHYLDKYDLLEKVENEVIEEMQEQIKDDNINLLSIDNVDQPLPFLIKLFEYFKENAVFIKAMLGSRGDPTFHMKLKKLIKENLFTKKQPNLINPDNMLVPEEYFVSYVLSAHLGVVQKWLESGMDKSPQEMALILTNMFFLGPFKVGGFGKDSLKG